MVSGSSLRYPHTSKVRILLSRLLNEVGSVHAARGRSRALFYIVAQTRIFIQCHAPYRESRDDSSLGCHSHPYTPPYYSMASGKTNLISSVLGDGFPIYSMPYLFHGGDQWKWVQGSERNGNVLVHRSTDHKLDKVRHPPPFII